MNEESLFAAALALPGAAARHAFLVAACGGNVALRRQGEEVLAAAGQTRGVPGRADPAPSAVHRTEPLAGGELFAGRFRLVRKVGAGGMGEVWVADQTEPVQRRVAL